MYKDIVLCVNEADGRDNTITAAVRFANQHNASLTGLYVRVTSVLTVPPYGMTSDQIVKEAMKREDERVANAKKEFDDIIDKLGCDATWLEVSEQDDNPLKIIAYSDLVITNQVAYDPRQGRSNIGFINNLILSAGKPVVLIPSNWTEPDFGSHIILGWDESREAARAVHDAMPLLQTADQVEAVCVNYNQQDEAVDVSQISTYLTRHNVSNSFKLEVTDEHLDTPEKVLLNYAKRRAADLIVVGGYGHSRLREIILGGVTRHLTKNSDIPVLFSH